MFEISRFLPCAALREYVDTYYLVAVDCPPGETLEDMMLPELPNLRFQLSGQWQVNFGPGFVDAPKSCVFGFTNAPYQVRVGGQSIVFGAGIKPLGWQALAEQPAHFSADKALDSHAVWPRRSALINGVVAALRKATSGKEMAAILDELLLDMLRPVPPVTRHILTSIDAVLSEQRDVPVTRVGDLADAMDLSVRQVERWTRQLFGCSPKLMLRKHRFLAMLARHGEQAAGEAWLEAADETFYDQSHFIREYKRFTGRSPGQYARQPSQLQKAVTQTLRRVEGRKPGAVRLKLDVRSSNESAA
ncbi:MAG: helix-turn-helix domain-containing protein [Pseudomonadota bacterium]